MKSRLAHLAALGEHLSLLSESECKTNTRVHGCTSVTHFRASKHSHTDAVVIQGNSDSKLARGLLALIALGLQSVPVQNALSVKAQDVIKASALHDALNASRAAGLEHIFCALHRDLSDDNVENNDEALDEHTSARHQNLSHPEGVEKQHMQELKERHPLNGRWSDRQGEDVAVLLSGGVDSSVALRKALETGARVQAFYLKIWLDDETAHLGECPWEEDIKYARAVCDQARVPLHDVPFQQEYWDRVVSYTIGEARHGRTPNPDVMCNSRIKFGAFYDRFSKDFDRIVSGHYARRTMCADSGLAELRLSCDPVKDQTYFLSHLKQEQLAKVWFPIGRLTKTEVRDQAEQYDLPNKERKDSQGICFLGKLKFDDFLGHHLGERKGSLVEFETGYEVGQHRGFWFFTVGQRRGIGLSGGPWHVVAKDVESNVVYVSRSYHSEDKERRSFDFDNALWISNEWPRSLACEGFHASMRVKTRHGPNFHDAFVTRTGENSGHVKLHSRDKGLASGQFVAFYDDGDKCYGSAVIRVEDVSTSSPKVIAMPSDWKKLQAHV